MDFIFEFKFSVIFVIDFFDVDVFSAFRDKKSEFKGNFNGICEINVVCVKNRAGSMFYVNLLWKKKGKNITKIIPSSINVIEYCVEYSSIYFYLLWFIIAERNVFILMKKSTKKKLIPFTNNFSVIYWFGSLLRITNDFLIAICIIKTKQQTKNIQTLSVI